MPSLSGYGIRAVALGVDGLLLGPSSSSPSSIDAHSTGLFQRMVLDPRNEPLAPLFRSQEGAAAQAPRLLAPFFGGLEPSRFYLKSSLHEGYGSPLGLREELAEILRADVIVAVWDNCLSGATSRVHSLLNQHYTGLFPGRRRFLSTSHRTSLGKREFLDLLLEGLGVALDELMVVTANPGHRDYALRCGARSLLFRPFNGETHALSLLASIYTYLGAPAAPAPGMEAHIHDPVAYMSAVADCVNAPEVDLKIRSLPKGHPLHDDVRFIREEILKRDAGCGALVSDVRCLLVDQRMHAPGGLASFMASFPEGSPRPPRFKSMDRVHHDVLELADGYLNQVERRIPSLARSALEALMKEIAPLCKIPEAAFLATGIVQEIERRVRNHITLNRKLYVDESRVFHDDEWAELADLFLADHDALDRRYEKWIKDTERAFREMAARKEEPKAIRRLVKERLVDDLILAVMELEMMVRSFEEKTPRPKLFPRHHDAKNRAATLTLNIGDKHSWKQATLLNIKTVQGWMQGMVMRQLRKAKEADVALKFAFSRDAGLPSLELSDLSEDERESLDHVLTELITNAVKYRADVTGSEVRVDIAEGEGTIALQVADNGVGIRDVDRVLAGFREHPEEKEGYGGGLASVIRHVASHPGWDLSVHSQVGVGSLFVLKAVLRDQGAQKKRLSDSGFPGL